MAWRTASWLDAVTASPLTTLETVALDTPARAATLSRVGLPAALLTGPPRPFCGSPAESALKASLWVRVRRYTRAGHLARSRPRRSEPVMEAASRRCADRSEICDRHH